MGRQAIRGVLAVCLTLAAADAVGEADARWRGNFIIGSRGLQLSPCLSGERFAVEDATPGRALAAAYRELTRRPGRPIYVVFQGRRVGPGLRATHLERAHADGPGCREVLREVRLRAYGMEPFWQLEIRQDAVLLRRRPSDTPATFPPEGLTDALGALRYEGASPDAVLRLTVTPGTCRDTLSASIFSLRAEAVLNDTRLTGCAYLGDYGPVPSADGPARPRGN